MNERWIDDMYLCSAALQVPADRATGAEVHLAVDHHGHARMAWTASVLLR